MKPWDCITIMGFDITGPESAAGSIGPINFQMKLTGKRSAGNPHAAFDEAGTGDGPTRHRASSRPYLGGGCRVTGIPTARASKEEIMSLDPKEVAAMKFKQVLEGKKDIDDKANAIVWAATTINAGLGVAPFGINFYTFIGVTTVMVVWLGSIYGQKLTNERASQIIKQIFYSVGAMFFMTTLGLKVAAELLKVFGVVALGGVTLAGMALDAVLMGAITYAIGFTSKEMFKKNQKLSSSEIKNIFKDKLKEGKQKVKECKKSEQQEERDEH